MTRKRFDSAPHINVKDEGMLIQQVAGSTTNLLEVKSHSGAILMAVDYAGTMTSGASNTFTYLAATTSASLPANTTIGAVSPTELGYLDGVTSAIQSQLNSKLSTAVTSLTGTSNQITVSASTGAVTLSIPSSPTLSGTVTAGGFSAVGTATLNRASATAWNAGANIRLQIDGTTYSTIGVNANSRVQFSGGLDIASVSYSNAGNSSYIEFGPNASWGAYLRVGSSAQLSGSGVAAVISTDGNLHLDAASNGKAMYLNYYSAGNSIQVYGSIKLNQNTTGYYQASTSSWSGNPGGGQGKIEYHSNRWYIASGSDSAEILRIRRDGSDVVVINNDGRVNAPFWTTTGRNYCNEWIQFDNHTGLYSPLNGAHLYPNNGSYGAWRIDGTRNTWRGIEFDAPGGNLSLMMDTVNGWGNQHVGVHNNSNGWIYYFQGRGLRTNSYLPISGNNTGQVGAWYGAEGSFNIMYSYAYVNYSDARTKHSVQSLEGGLDFIERLRPVQYKYIYENRLGYEPDEHGVELPVISSEPVSVEYGSRYRYGFIAQEVKQALEDTGKNPGDYVVWSLGDKEDPESTQQLEYLQFIGPLVAAVQELSAKVAVLEAERGI